VQESKRKAGKTSKNVNSRKKAQKIHTHAQQKQINQKKKRKKSTNKKITIQTTSIYTLKTKK
jgi:hypothetical protein